jgi:antitoxin PrlF
MKEMEDGSKRRVQRGEKQPYTPHPIPYTLCLRGKMEENTLTPPLERIIVRDKGKELYKEVSMIATVTSKGQVTLPAEARKRLRLGPGSKLEFIVIDDERLEAIPVVETLGSLKGMVPQPKKTLSLAEMDRAIAEGAGR